MVMNRFFASLCKVLSKIAANFSFALYEIRFDCDVIEYCGEGSEAGKHLVQYCDGIQEWRMLNEYRLVMDSPSEDENLGERDE